MVRRRRRQRRGGAPFKSTRRAIRGIREGITDFANHDLVDNLAQYASPTAYNRYLGLRYDALPAINRFFGSIGAGRVGGSARIKA